MLIGFAIPHIPVTERSTPNFCAVPDKSLAAFELTKTDNLGWPGQQCGQIAPTGVAGYANYETKWLRNS